MPSAELMKQQSECLSVILEKNEKEEKSYVVGLEHVTEYQNPKDKTVKYYHCQLIGCYNEQGNSRQMARHLRSYTHKQAWIRSKLKLDLTTREEIDTFLDSCPIEDEVHAVVVNLLLWTKCKKARLRIEDPKSMLPVELESELSKSEDSDVSLSDEEDGPQTGRVAASGTVNSSRSEQDESEPDTDNDDNLAKASSMGDSNILRAISSRGCASHGENPTKSPSETDNSVDKRKNQHEDVVCKAQEGGSKSATSNPGHPIPPDLSQEGEKQRQKEQAVPQPDIERQQQQQQQKESQQVPEQQHREPGDEQIQQPQQKESYRQLSQKDQAQQQHHIIGLPMEAQQQKQNELQSQQQQQLEKLQKRKLTAAEYMKQKQLEKEELHRKEKEKELLQQKEQERQEQQRAQQQHEEQQRAQQQREEQQRAQQQRQEQQRAQQQRQEQQRAQQKRQEQVTVKPEFKSEPGVIKTENRPRDLLRQESSEIDVVGQRPGRKEEVDVELEFKTNVKKAVNYVLHLYFEESLRGDDNRKELLNDMSRPLIKNKGAFEKFCQILSRKLREEIRDSWKANGDEAMISNKRTGIDTPKISYEEITQYPIDAEVLRYLCQQPECLSGTFL